jgi:hypothetical protein
MHPEVFSARSLVPGMAMTLNLLLGLRLSGTRIKEIWPACLLAGRIGRAGRLDKQFAFIFRVMLRLLLSPL